ncbi:uncharacterized protein LOC125075413 [Vanessa atalanta]|uniref:uncharacterized protein LOC125075413 n=1 Tax=Vanessa atalanta TaxID=42275 RepID=UPI001FCDF125|nr:uncharacterized protein LOC125075413 [Vanessa atalanta]
MSANNPKKRQKNLFDDLSSNSEYEQDQDPYKDEDGDYGSDENYEPQQTGDADASTSSEEIFSVRPRRRTSGGPVASSDSSKSDITNVSSHSDFGQDDRPTSQIEPLIPESRDGSPSLVAPQDNNSNDTDSAPVQNRPRSPEPEYQPWSNTTEDIPVFDFDVNSHGPQFEVNSQTSVEEIFNHVFPKELIDYLVQCTNNYGTALCNSNRPSTRYSRSQSFRLTTAEEMTKFLGLSLLHGHIRIPK